MSPAGAGPVACTRARALASERLDGSANASGDAWADTSSDRVLDEHLASCAACTDFERTALRVRRALRFEPVGPRNDTTAAVLRRLPPEPTVDPTSAAPPTRTPTPARAPVAPHRGRRRDAVLGGVALFVACVLLGYGVTRWTGGVGRAVAAERSALVALAQARVHALSARVVLTETPGPASSTRRAAGTLAYVAPEALVLRLADDSPGSTDRGSTVEVGVNGSTAWRVDDQGTTVVRGREPFAASGWSALELIVPVDAFGRDAARAEPVQLDGRAAVLVTTSVAQVGELLDAFRTGGGWRPLYPADRVTLWLDASTASPLRLEVERSSDPDRAAWAARQALDEPEHGPLFVVALSEVVTNGIDAAVPPPPPLAPSTLPDDPTSPAAPPVRDLGFTDRSVSPEELPRPGWLPDGMAPYRMGEQRSPGSSRAVLERTWSNGRSWVKVVGTRGWDGGRVFGDLGAVASPVPSVVGVLYRSEDGSSVALHGDGLDLVVSGSLGPDQLIRVAESLGVGARPVPADWAEADSRTLSDLDALSLPVLAPTEAPPGAQVGVAVHGQRAELSVTGPGASGVRMVEAPGTDLAPPEDPDARGVTVRGRPGRSSPNLGELTWVERGRVIVLSTHTRTTTELIDLAGTLQWSR